MLDAIELLEALKGEYKVNLEALREPEYYYEDLNSKVKAIEEALQRLRNFRPGLPRG